MSDIYIHIKKLQNIIFTIDSVIQYKKLHKIKILKIYSLKLDGSKIQKEKKNSSKNNINFKLYNVVISNSF